MESLLHIAVSNAVVATGLAIVAVIVGRLCRRPALTHGLWVLVLLKLVTPPLVFVPVPWLAEESNATLGAAVTPEADTQPLLVKVFVVPDGERAEGPIEDVAFAVPVMSPESGDEQEVGQTNAAALTASASTGPDWLVIAAGCSLFGSVAWLVLAASRARRFHELLKFARPASHSLQREIARLSERLGLSCPPAAWMVPGAVSPMLWGLSGVPRLLLPSELLERLTPEQRQTVLVHELAHYLRRDHWVRWLELLVTCLFWWHPVVWWARRELRESEELCCDAWVVWALPNAGRAYATALVECLDFLSCARPLPIGASGVGRIDDLKRRLTMILGGTTPRRLTWVGGVMLLGLGAVLPVLPTRADDNREKPAERQIDPKNVEQLREQIEQLRKALQERGGQNDPKEVDRVRERTEHLRKAVDYIRAIEVAPDTKADPKEVDRARADVEKLKKELEERTKAVKEIEAKLREAAERLAKLQGHAGIRYRVIVVGDDGKPVQGLPGLPGVPAVPGVPADGVIRWDFRRDLTKPTDKTPMVVPHPPQGGGDQRMQDLERKLEAIMRELQELRRQIPARPPGGGGPRPDSGFRPGPGGGGDRFRAPDGGGPIPGPGGAGPRDDGRSVAPRPGSGNDRETPRPRSEDGTRKPETRIDNKIIEIEIDRSKSTPERKPER